MTVISWRKEFRPRALVLFDDKIAKYRETGSGRLFEWRAGGSGGLSFIWFLGALSQSWNWEEPLAEIEKRRRTNLWVHILWEIIHRRSSVGSYLLLSCTADFAVSNEVCRKLLDRKDVSSAWPSGWVSGKRSGRRIVRFRFVTTKSSEISSETWEERDKTLVLGIVE